jgi:flagellar biosynthesis protein FliR
VSQFYVVLATLVFLGLDGHLILVGVLAESFHTLPIGLGGIGADGLWRLAGQAGWLFSASLLIALPVVTALLIVNLSFGVMSRATPSLNVFTLGFPVALGFGFTLMWVTVPVVAGHLEDLFSRGIGLAATLVGVSR